MTTQNKLPAALFTVKNGTLLVIKDFDNIMYCQAEGNYTTIHLEPCETILVSKCLKEVQKLLPADTFCRIHKKYLINLKQLKEITNKEKLIVVLKNNEKLVVSARSRKILIETLKNRFYKVN